MINQVEGLVEFKKYKIINSPKVCDDKLYSEADEKRAKKDFLVEISRFVMINHVMILQVKKQKLSINQVR